MSRPWCRHGYSGRKAPLFDFFRYRGYGQYLCEVFGERNNYKSFAPALFSAVHRLHNVPSLSDRRCTTTVHSYIIYKSLSNVDI